MDENTTIPPLSEAIICGRSDQVENIDTRYATFEPVSFEERDLIVAKTFVDPFKKQIPVRIVNLQTFPVKLRRNSVLGELSPVIDFNEIVEKMDDPLDRAIRLAQKDVQRDIRISSSKEELVIPENWKNGVDGKVDDRNKADISDIPQHLEDLYKRSCENLTSKEQREKLGEILKKHQNTFAKTKDDLGTCSILEHTINTGGAAPVRQPLRRTPREFETEEEQYLKEQVENGIIKPSNSAWASPVVLVRKKDGSVRWCCDFRKLNDSTIKDAYPLPRIDMCLDCLSTASVFSTMDLQSGYWQIKLREEDQHKTAFITKYGLWEYTKMPFGLCNAPSTFQRCMELIFRGMQWKTLLIYLDDLILYSSNISEHFSQLDEVLSKLCEAGLKLKPSKCEFIKDEVLYLGHIVTPNGIKPNPKIVESVEKWKTPTSVKEVQQFLGLCNYYRRFINKFSDKATCLTELTKKGVKFEWTKECEDSFNTLKETLCSAPILAYPRPNESFILDTDASNVGIGGVLSQIQDGEEKVIAYASKKLDRHQQNYSVTRRELLAMVTFVNQFKHYLLGRRFLLRTDHGSLRWLFGFKDPQGQVARWIEVLNQYDFEIKHRDGVKHLNADALSRRDDIELCSHSSISIGIKENCEICKELQDEWAEFTNDVDNVHNLADNKEIADIRVVTRSQTHKDSSNWLPQYTTLDLYNFQKEDPDIGPLHEWKKANSVPSRDEAAKFSPATRKYWLNWQNIVIESDVLYQKIIDPFGKTDKLQLLVPRVLRKEILVNCHDSVFAAHFGVHKTVEKIKQYYYWYKMREDVQIHIKECPSCNKWKDSNRKPRAGLSEYRVGYPMDRVGIDIIGPLPCSNQDNRYILVVGDHFTRWMEAYPIPNQQAEEVARQLANNFISRFGAPLEIHTDQGPNFESVLFKELCSLLHITKTRTTPYRPSSNGLIERFNKTLENMIKTFVQENPRDWDLYIDLLMAAYRSTVHPATGFTPNKMMFGREVNLPIHIIYPIPDDENSSIYSTEYVREMKDKLEQLYEMVRGNLGEATLRQKKDYDTRLSQNRFSPGTLVYKLKPVHKKLETAWAGPYVILEELSSVVYKIRHKDQTEVVHHDRLKPCHVKDIPKWAKCLCEKILKH